MRTMEAARAFAEEWIAAWNAHDLDAVLSHYTDDVVFFSPRIAAVTGRDVSCVSGKPALKSYWAEALGKAPTLKFTLEDVYLGRDTLTVAYSNHRGQHAVETLIFNDEGFVREGVAAYR